MQKAKGIGVLSWYCPNCGALLTGIKNERNKVKIECPRCHATTIRIIKSRRHDMFDMYSAPGEEHNDDLILF